jgi:hypothetical protein
MIHHSASPQPRPAGRGIPRIRRRATGLAVAAIASLAGAPAALAGPLPPPGGTVTDPIPVAPPPAPAAAHLPLWAVVTIVAATAVLSVATTLITLALEHRRRTRRTPPPAGQQTGAQLDRLAGPEAWAHVAPGCEGPPVVAGAVNTMTARRQPHRVFLILRGRPAAAGSRSKGPQS